MSVLSGWGGIDRVSAQVHRARDDGDVIRAMSEGPLIARGMGRSYGDSALGRRVLDMLGCNRMIAFDERTGVLIAQAGVTLAEIIEAFLPRGWFPLVTPGTKFVSLGGALAADVHGKNHHVDGSFGACVDWMDVADATGRVIRCSREAEADLFHHTLGGMGLTGVILRAQIRLRPVESGWIRQTVTPARDLDAAIDLFERTLDQRYSVAWIDCLASGTARGRALVMTGDHAPRASLPADLRENNLFPRQRSGPNVPFNFPAIALNSLSVRAFNALYWWNGNRSAGTRLVHWDSYFYPLDAVGHWNRIYGRRGFTQFQCVLPLGPHREGLAEILDTTSRAGGGSFLAVLKRFGEQSSPLSFPMAGYTLALDFANTDRNRETIARLHDITRAHGGRIYLAKDRFMTPEGLHESDPRWRAFGERRAEQGIAARFQSSQSERLKI